MLVMGSYLASSAEKLIRRCPRSIACERRRARIKGCILGASLSFNLSLLLWTRFFFSMAQQICRYFDKPGGCRRGSNCSFLHGRGGAPVRGRGASRTGRGGSPSSPSSATSSSGVPSGVCTFFWNTGECTRGFSCRARHDINPANSRSSSTSVPPSAASSIPVVLAPFLTDAGLARIHESSADVFLTNTTKPRSPTDVHNFLKRFLYDSYHFRSSLDVYAFVGLLADANTNNGLWVSSFKLSFREYTH